MKALSAIRTSAVAILVISVSFLTTGLPEFNDASVSASDGGDKLFGEVTGQLLPVDSNLYKVRTNDPFLDRQWALDKIRISTLLNLTANIQDTLVAVLDTGIDSLHPDLKDKVVSEVNFTDSPTVSDLNGHGTHVAGIITADTNNGIGIAGLAPESKIMNVKVVGDDGICQASTVARGLVWAVDNGAKVINISLEIEPSVELEKAVNYAWERGAIIIAAAGNSASTTPVYPAHYDKCIAVASTGQNDELAPLSNYGDWIDVMAPGFLIFSTLPGDSYGYESGTSSAAAYVSGLAALLMSIIADTNGNGRVNDEVRNAIENGCQKVNFTGSGNGRIDALICSAKLN
jgi:thermitase